METQVTNTTADIDDAITTDDLNRITELALSRGPEFIAALRRRLEREPEGEESPVWQDWLEQADRNDPNYKAPMVLLHRLLNHANPDVRQEAAECLRRWDKEIFTSKAAMDLIDYGYQAAAELIMYLSLPQPVKTSDADETGGHGLLSFFQNLSNRDKLLCDTYNTLLCVNGGCAADEPKTDIDRIAAAVMDYDPNSFTDHETAYLYGVCQVAQSELKR